MTAPTTRPMGIVYGMPFEEYLAVDALSATALKLFARSPWHYRNALDKEPTPAMRLGTLAHCATLEPDALAKRYAVLPENAPRRPTQAQWKAKNPSAESMAAMDWWTQFNASLQGRELVSAGDYATCQHQVAAILREPELARLLGKGRSEVSVFWIDKKTGLYCKARPDHVHQDGHTVDLLDVKTCMDESPNGFGRAAARLRYDLQDAHYVDGWKHATKVAPRQFVFGAVTSKPPVLAVPYVLTDEIRDQAAEERRELMERLVWCRQEDRWPAYGDGLQLLDFPAYAKHGGEAEVEWIDEGATA